VKPFALCIVTARHGTLLFHENFPLFTDGHFGGVRITSPRTPPSPQDF
jgi:hypothetical protein